MAEYNPNKLGWPAAAVTVVGTLGLLFTAYSIHEKTYRHPRDPMAVQVYHAEDKAAEHAAAGAEHGAAAGTEHSEHAPAAGASTGAAAGASTAAPAKH